MSDEFLEERLDLVDTLIFAVHDVETQTEKILDWTEAEWGSFVYRQHSGILFWRNLIPML